MGLRKYHRVCGLKGNRSPRILPPIRMKSSIKIGLRLANLLWRFSCLPSFKHKYSSRKCWRWTNRAISWIALCSSTSWSVLDARHSRVSLRTLFKKRSTHDITLSKRDHDKLRCSKRSTCRAYEVNITINVPVYWCIEPRMFRFSKYLWTWPPATSTVNILSTNTSWTITSGVYDTGNMVLLFWGTCFVDFSDTVGAKGLKTPFFVFNVVGRRLTYWKINFP